VKQMMAAAIGNGTAETLDEAYDMACNAIPSIRQKIREGERKAEEAKRAEEQRKKASEAKRAQTVNVGSSARRVASVPSGKWDSDTYLENVFDRVSGG
jgi:septal ring factor EnvC (AmiA/AmiB activator)